jgi:epoxyqueuosine reductase
MKRQALSLGFDAVGVAPIAPYPHADFFREWLARGWHGEMAYLDRNADKRLDPRQVMPDARSIVCLAKVYRTQDIPDEVRQRPSRGIISRYAWGDDYHDVLGAQARRLRDWIRQNGGEGADGRAYVDTGPVLEREAAMLAGLGWIGKNTMLLSRELGSYFFLAEIITNVAFEPDAPTTDHCGTCRRCLDACPTQAFPEPYVLDARRCISYLTIERKGAIPVEFREAIGNHVFGCDICQEVCPWNRKAPLADNAEYAPRDGLLAPKLVSLMGMDEEEFRRRFRASPVKRAKRRGLLRNVAVALGNSHDERAVPALAKGLDDAEPLVRAHAAWALGQIGGERARARLLRAANNETEPDVQKAIQAALGRIAQTKQGEGKDASRRSTDEHHPARRHVAGGVLPRPQSRGRARRAPRQGHRP